MNLRNNDLKSVPLWYRNQKFGYVWIERSNTFRRILDNILNLFLYHFSEENKQYWPRGIYLPNYPYIKTDYGTGRDVYIRFNRDNIILVDTLYPVDLKNIYDKIIDQTYDINNIIIYDDPTIINQAVSDTLSDLQFNQSIK